MMRRRGLFGLAVGLIAAPAIVRSENIMNVSFEKPPLRGQSIYISYVDDIWFAPAGHDRGIIDVRALYAGVMRNERTYVEVRFGENGRMEILSDKPITIQNTKGDNFTYFERLPSLT